jgi:hypothetical protein
MSEPGLLLPPRTFSGESSWHRAASALKAPGELRAWTQAPLGQVCSLPIGLREVWKGAGVSRRTKAMRVLDHKGHKGSEGPRGLSLSFGGSWEGGLRLLRLSPSLMQRCTVWDKSVMAVQNRVR